MDEVGVWNETTCGHILSRYVPVCGTGRDIDVSHYHRDKVRPTTRRAKISSLNINTINIDTATCSRQGIRKTDLQNITCLNILVINIITNRIKTIKAFSA